MPPPDNYAQAAGRHLWDAEILRGAGRLDNAVYLAGYVVECSLKLLVSQYLSPKDAKRYGHNLPALQGTALRQLQILIPAAHLKLPVSRTAGTVLEQGHPERRYWPSQQWTEHKVQAALRRACDIYGETVLAMVLNGQLSYCELQV